VAVTVRPLRPEDDRSGFSSGDRDLDRFFYVYAGQNQFRHHIGTTYVAVQDARIVGFATIAASHIEIEDLPAARRRRLPRYPLPVLRLARLATDESVREKGIGAVLLRAVFEIAWRMADEMGCVGIVVDAKPAAVGFYERYGFFRLRVTAGSAPGRASIPMFLELAAVPRTVRFPAEPGRLVGRLGLHG
jgi:GNAT superfamily N-acetyltransferase